MPFFVKSSNFTPLFIKEGLGEISSKIPLKSPFCKGGKLNIFSVT